MRARLLTALLAGAMILTLPATAGAEARPAQGRGEVVLSLASSSPATLQAAASAPAPRSAAERRARLRALEPTGATRSRALRWLRSRGFTITDTTAWTVTAEGPVAALGPRGIPASLRRTVAGIARPTDAPVWQPRAVPTGYGPPELQSAYASPGDGAGATIATVQFSGWREADAQVYADAAGIPLAEGQITSISVRRARTTQPDGLGGDFEVALDVEAVLAGAPAATQRVYIAPNNAAGTIGVYDTIATDAETAGLTAVSTSWGACEPDTDPALVSAVEQHLQRILAAGATVFAASGDAGAYGCATPDFPTRTLAVDYPAASPHVVAVGGTSLTRQRDGAWAERGWSTRADSFPGYAGSGSGGGVSQYFRERPAWQAFVPLPDDARLVPDISSVADPETGLGVYAPYAEGQRGWVKAGGTSAGAPLQAGLMVSALTRLGRTTGVGDIHTAVYGAANGAPGTVRDVTTGHNHAFAAVPGYDLVTGVGSPVWGALAARLVQPALLAPWGSRTQDIRLVTALPAGLTATGWSVGEGEVSCAAGGPRPTSFRLPDGPDRVVPVTVAVTAADGSCVRTTSQVLLDRTAPATAAGLRARPRRSVAMSWAADEGAVGSGVVAYAVRLVRSDGRVMASRSADRAGGALQSVPPGTYTVQVTATDRVGNRSVVATSAPVTVS